MVWRVLREAELHSTPMIVPAVSGEDLPEMRLVEDDDVIEAFSPDRTDQAFDVRILPGTRGRGDHLGDAVPARRRWNASV